MEQTLKHEVYSPKSNTIASFAIKMRDWTAEYTLKRERIEKEQAQADYCKSVGIPNFMPNTCYRCRKHVVDYYALTVCATIHLTGCGFCNKSFVD